MYPRILVAVNGSDTSRHALKPATSFVTRLPAKLRSVHNVDMSWLSTGPELATDTGAISAAQRCAGEAIIAAAQRVRSSRLPALLIPARQGSPWA